MLGQSSVARWTGPVPLGPFLFGQRAALVNRQTLSFRAFIQRVHPRFVWYTHCERLVAVLQRVADGELKRLIVLAPPRHSKSETVTRLFSAYLIHRYPEQWVGLGAYGAQLAYTFSRAARAFARAAGVRLRADTEGVEHWETEEGGGLWAAGVGGPATGKGFHWGILDDPVKNAAEAASATIADRNREWWESTWYTRQEPGAALVVILTRWPGLADLIGWFFEQEQADEYPEHWHVVAFEAEKSAEPYPIPPTCTLEPDWRQPGEALCPERYPLDKLRKVAKRIGSYFFAALFQQRPGPREGGLFKWNYWGLLEAVPALGPMVRYWDTAGTDKTVRNDPDYTAGALLCRMPDDRTAIVDVVRFRYSPARRDAQILEVAKADLAAYRGRVVWWFETEAGIQGTERTAAIVRRVQALGLAVYSEHPTGSKLNRAEPLAAAAEAGNVLLCPGAWRDGFRARAADFTGAEGGEDDEIDAADGAFAKVSPVREVKVRTFRV